MDTEGYEQLSKKCSATVIRFLAEHLNRLEGRLVNELYWVQLLLLSRILRCHSAVRLLVREGLCSEAAIIALTQFETSLDALYIGLNVSRATTWVEHTSERSQPWSVGNKIREIYASDPHRMDANFAVFRDLSQIKHSNPAAGGFGFPVRREGDTLQLSTGPMEDVFEEFQGRLLLAFSSFSLLEVFEVAGAAFGKFESMPEEYLVEIAALKTQAGDALGRAGDILPGARTETTSIQ